MMHQVDPRQLPVETPSPRDVLIALKIQFERQPTRTEWVGDQRRRYLNRDEVLAAVDEALRQLPTSTT